MGARTKGTRRASRHRTAGAPPPPSSPRRSLPYVDGSWRDPRSGTRRTARLSALVRQRCARGQNGDAWRPISALTVIGIPRACDSDGGGDGGDGGSDGNPRFGASAEQNAPSAYLTKRRKSRRAGRDEPGSDIRRARENPARSKRLQNSYAHEFIGLPPSTS